MRATWFEATYPLAYWKDRAERAERLCLLGSSEERMCADAAEAWRDATETVGLHAGRAVVAEAFRLVLVRLREVENESFKRYYRAPTLGEQYGALIAGFEDVLKEMGDSVNTENAESE